MNLNSLHAGWAAYPEVPPTSGLSHLTSSCSDGASASNMASRLEINFIRLLSRCESIASEKRGETEWRLEKVRPDEHGANVSVQHRFL